MHKRKRITIGKPYKVQVLGDGDGFTFPKTHDWVELNYKLYVKEKEVRVWVGCGVGCMSERERESERVRAMNTHTTSSTPVR